MEFASALPTLRILLYQSKGFVRLVVPIKIHRTYEHVHQLYVCTGTAASAEGLLSCIDCTLTMQNWLLFTSVLEI